MDWEQFLRENSGALVALAGVALGGLIGAAASLITQSVQRRWQLNDQRSEWRRRRLQEQLELVITWQDQWIRLASHLRSAEGSPEEAKRLSRKARQAEIGRLSESLQRQGNILRELTAVTIPIVTAIGDPRLKSLDSQFRDAAARYKNILEEKDVEQAVTSNINVATEIAQINANTRERADQLLLETFQAQR